MNIGGGEAADQLVRMMLSGTEVAVRLGGSALKNMLALTMALAKNNKALYGKVSLGKMLRETRNLRQFPMTPEQYKEFSRLARKQKILFSAISDKDDKGKLIDVILPETELDRANMLFERITYNASKPEAAQQETEPQQESGTPEKEETQSKKDIPSARDSPATKRRASTPQRAETSTTSERPSVEGRLKGYRAQLDQRQKSAPVKKKSKEKAVLTAGKNSFAQRDIVV